MVVTNSFHGAVFSILFHKPFILIPVEGKLSGMNDRIITLMQNFGLSDRIIDSLDSEKIKELEANPIDWVSVDNKIAELKKTAFEFINNALNVKE